MIAPRGMLMPDPDKPNEDRRALRAKRRGPVIDLTAQEIAPPAAVEPTSSVEAQPDASAPADNLAPASAPADPAPVFSESFAEAPAREASMGGPEPEIVVSRTDLPPEPEFQPQPEPLRRPEPDPEPQLGSAPVSPPASEQRSSMVAPLIAAAVAGAFFGGLAGWFAPKLAGGAGGPDVARIAAVENAQQQLIRNLSSLAPNAEVDKLRQTVARLEAQPPGAAPAGPSPEPRLAALEAEIRALAARPQPEPPTAVPPPPPPPVDLSPLQDRIATLEAQLKAVDGRADAAAKAAESAGAAARSAGEAADPKIAALGQKLDQALAQSAARVEASRAAPLFSAVQALGQAFHRGAPYATEISTAEALGAKPEQLQALKPFAERGAPTPQRLLESFSPLAGRLAGDESQSGVWGVFGRFVTVRPTTESAANTPAAIVGAIEASLRRGDVSAAVAAWNRLPEPARNASAEWGAQAARRDEAAKALAALQETAAAALRK